MKIKLGFDISKTIHFIGIGGIGMSGIAEILVNLGYKVQGSDISENANIQRLKKMGINVFLGHEGSYVHDADVVVVSSAIIEDNPEYQTAIALNIPVIKRADMLAEIMRFRKSIAVAGTHGKTTTTSMNATLLDCAGFDPTIINGGIINTYSTNAKLGSGEWVVAEADESDGSFTKLPATIGIITNIDKEHIDHYGSFDALKKAFHSFIENIPFYGAAILCTDHPVVLELSKKIKNKKIFTYGFNENADIKGVNIRPQKDGCLFDVEIISRKEQKKAADTENVSFIPKKYKDLFLPMVGEHNVLNFLSCIAIAEQFGISEQIIIEALSNFKGVKRRFSKVGEANGITIIDDYAHHPEEIRTVIKAAKQCQPEKIICIIQPHRYSRLKNGMADYVSAAENSDIIILAPVYAAGEKSIEGVSSAVLAEEIRKRGKLVFEFNEPKEIPYIIARVATKGDMVLFLGAGTITNWAAMLPLQLEKLEMSNHYPLLNSQQN